MMQLPGADRGDKVPAAGGAPALAKRPQQRRRHVIAARIGLDAALT